MLCDAREQDHRALDDAKQYIWQLSAGEHACSLPQLNQGQVDALAVALVITREFPEVLFRQDAALILPPKGEVGRVISISNDAVVADFGALVAAIRGENVISAAAYVKLGNMVGSYDGVYELLNALRDFYKHDVRRLL